MNMNSYNCCTPDTEEFAQLDHLADMLQLLAEKNRLQILCLLRQHAHCVCEIQAHFDMSQSLLSHHLADLRAAGLVSNQKQGRRVEYSLTPHGRKVIDSIFAF